VDLQRFLADNLFMKSLFFIFITALFFVTTNCQSKPLTSFQNIALGDNKGAVLNTLGNPVRTYHKNDAHRWVYRFKNAESQVVEKEVWFKDGEVVYIDSLAEKPKKSPQASDYVPVE
jgi:hypothetical protein